MVTFSKTKHLKNRSHAGNNTICPESDRCQTDERGTAPRPTYHTP